MNSKNNDVLRNNVLKYCVVEERADICRALNEIHTEQNSIKAIQDEDVIAKGEKMMDATERDQLKILRSKFMGKLREHIPFITTEVCRNNDECAAILSSMNQKESPEEFYNVLQIERERIKDTIKEYQDYDVDLNGETMTCQKALNVWIRACEKICKEYREIKLDVAKQVMRNKIKKELAKNTIAIRDYFQAGHCNIDIINELMPYVIEPRRACMIIDDISHILSASNKGKQKVTINGKLMDEKDAIAEGINQYLNKGRHIGTTFIAVHTIQNLGSLAAQSVSNIILPPTTQILKSANRTFFIMETPEKKAEVSLILDDLKKYNAANGTYYTLICYKDTSFAPDNKSSYVLFQARPHNYSAFNIAPYKNSPFYYKLAEYYCQKNNIQKVDIADTDFHPKYIADRDIMEDDTAFKHAPVQQQKQSSDSSEEYEDDDEYEDDYEDEDDDS